MMTKRQCLGLIGGLGIGATIHFYKDLAMSSRACGKPLEMLIAHADLSSVFGFIRENDRKGLARYLVELIRRMERGGATIAAISAMTPHFAIEELLAISPLPIVDVFTCFMPVIAARGIKRVTLFGTRFVMDSELFGRLPNVEFVAPHPQEIDAIDSIYTDLTVDAEATAQQYRVLSEIAHMIVNREGVDAIVLAGTELSLVFTEGNTQFPVVDCANLHLKAIKTAMGIEHPLHADDPQ